MQGLRFNIIENMSVKRKMSSRISIEVVEQVTKRVKINSIPLNSDTIAHILPKLSHGDFENYMMTNGPEEWKRATDELSSLETKKLVLMIIRYYSLLPIFAVYLSFWELETKCADFLYELGLGHSIRQANLSNEPKNVYLCLMRIDPHEKYISPLLPTLKHNKHYFCLNKNFAKNDIAKVNKRIIPDVLSQEQLFYKKLSSALVCAKLQRWSECLAFSLSALDDYQPEYAHLHDVLTYIAWSGNKMSVSMDWCIKVLEEAKLVATSIEHTWRRVTVFQSCLIENGFFDLENEVYGAALPLFVQGTEHLQTFKLHHLQAKLAQIENNLVFQYCRQHFHTDCIDFCEKPPCIEQSFEATSRLLHTVDACASTITLVGVKEYFRGYYYLYSSMKQVYAQERNTNNVNLAICMFQSARDVMKTTDPLYADLILILGFLKKAPLTIHAINLHFSKKTHMKNTAGASQFYFRAMLITMYWDNVFQPFPVNMLVTNAYETEIKTTNNEGYRLKLIYAVTKVMESNFSHTPDKSIEDFPIVTLSKEREKLLERATSYWAKETEEESFHPLQTQQQFIQEQKLNGLLNANNDIIKQKPPTAQSIIRKNKMAEQVYAFGYQIVEAWTEG